MTNILVIDDDPMCLEPLQQLLMRQGFKVETAPNGQEGLRLLQQNQPDLVITDLSMPELEGRSVIQALRNETPEVKIIVMTGDYDRAEADTDAQELLKKPLVFSELLDSIQQLLDD